MHRAFRWTVVSLAIAAVLGLVATASARPPLIQIVPVPDQEVDPWFPGVTFSYDVDYEVTDPPCFGEDVFFSLDVAPAGMTINGFTGRISWSPDQSQRERIHTVRVKATAFYSLACGGRFFDAYDTFEIFVC